ncbi:MAG: hypothetical protein ACPGVT_03030 [Maricaulaceae bacterium]
MRLALASLITLLALGFILTNQPPKHTKLDYLFRWYDTEHPDFTYKNKCRKPKAFRGFNKYRVSCLEISIDEALEKIPLSSHGGGPLSAFSMRWKFVGVSETPQSQIQEKVFNERYPIQVYEKLEVKDNCNWRIYMTYPDEWYSNAVHSKAGDRIYFADPMALHCGDARIDKSQDDNRH